MSDAFSAWHKYDVRTGVPKPIRGSSDHFVVRDAFLAGFFAGVSGEGVEHGVVGKD